MSDPHLSHALDLEELQRSPDGAGGFAQTWVRLGTVWADIRAGAGRERADQTRPQSVQSLIVTVRGAQRASPRRPRPDQRFRAGARIIAIEAVAEGDPMGRYLVCRCVEEVGT